jgi:SM-20-related protein
VSTVTIELNPQLDAEALARDYKEKRRLQLRRFMTDESADAVHGALGELPWGMAYNDGPQVVQLSGEQIAQLDSRQAGEIMAGIRERARDRYQFLYSFFPILTAYFAANSPRFPIFDFYEFLNSEPTLDLIRKVSGLPQIRWADAQATWFKPGHFLNAHTEEEAATSRVAAYVMTLSPLWERDWGGFLQFFDANDNIEAAYQPSFNTLNLFTIPQLHSVSMVSTYVTENRLAVTGWFRSDEPPGESGRRS